MAGPQPRSTEDEFARQGDAMYERDILPRLEPDSAGKFIVIDIETGDYEIDRSELAASDRLRARRPHAQAWLRRIGHQHVRRYGTRRPIGPR